LLHLRQVAVGNGRLDPIVIALEDEIEAFAGVARDAVEQRGWWRRKSTGRRAPDSIPE
jgi:hypothetical protein